MVSTILISMDSASISNKMRACGNLKFKDELNYTDRALEIYGEDKQKWEESQLRYENPKWDLGRKVSL